jgi:TRAP-type C4-dicarboxylate transport system permease small subunit
MPPDPLGRWLARADKRLAAAERLLTLFAGLLIFGLMVLGVVQIVMRTVFSAPIFGYIDIVEFSMIGFAILGISYVQRLGGHVRMEIIVGRLKGRALWLFEWLGTLLACLIVALLIPYSYLHFERAWSFGDSTIDIELPTWPAKLIVPIALSILLVRLVVQLIDYARLVRSPDLQPVAAPAIKGVEQQAEEEIEGAR